MFVSNTSLLLLVWLVLADGTDAIDDLDQSEDVGRRGSDRIRGCRGEFHGRFNINLDFFCYVCIKKSISFAYV